MCINVWIYYIYIYTYTSSVSCLADLCCDRSRFHICESYACSGQRSGQPCPRSGCGPLCLLMTICFPACASRFESMSGFFWLTPNSPTSSRLLMAFRPAKSWNRQPKLPSLMVVSKLDKLLSGSNRWMWFRVANDSQVPKQCQLTMGYG